MCGKQTRGGGGGRGAGGVLRNFADEWVRVHVSEGDMIRVPAGMYHRFTLDTSNSIRVMRLFCGACVRAVCVCVGGGCLRRRRGASKRAWVTGGAAQATRSGRR